jgi:parallel beta-helix repeat protein
VLPGESIHAAVKAAQPGDTIQLHPGVYEDVVVIKKDDTSPRCPTTSCRGAGAGLCVGDSAHANLTMTGNETFDNRYGIFLRDSQNGDVTGNRSTATVWGS